MSSKIINKRINREIPELSQKYGPLNIVSLADNTYSIIQLTNYNIDVKINSNYPFHPPDMFINNKSYLTVIIDYPKYVYKKLNEKGITCLCCESILCKNRWNPSIKIINIIDEYFKNRKLICDIIKKKIVEEICIKNNINCLLLINKIQGFI